MNLFIYIIKVSIKSIIKYIIINVSKSNKKISSLTYFNIKLKNNNKL